MLGRLTGISVLMVFSMRVQAAEHDRWHLAQQKLLALQKALAVKQDKESAVKTCEAVRALEHALYNGPHKREILDPHPGRNNLDGWSLNQIYYAQAVYFHAIDRYIEAIQLDPSIAKDSRRDVKEEVNELLGDVSVGARNAQSLRELGQFGPNVATFRVDSHALDGMTKNYFIGHPNMTDRESGPAREKLTSLSRHQTYLLANLGRFEQYCPPGAAPKSAYLESLSETVQAQARRDAPTEAPFVLPNPHARGTTAPAPPPAPPSKP